MLSDNSQFIEQTCYIRDSLALGWELILSLFNFAFTVYVWFEFVTRLQYPELCCFGYLLLWLQSVQILPHFTGEVMKDFANEQTQKCVFLCLSIHCRILSHKCRTLSHWICSMLFIGRLYFRGSIICPISALLGIYLTRTRQTLPGW